MLQIEILQQHLGVEDVLLIHIDIHHVVQRLHILRHKVLDRIDLMIDVMLHAGYIAGETAYAIVHGDDIGFQLMDQIVQRFER
ncbi:hypothetical protein D3C80_1521700 [compost metagenome]